MTCYVVSKEAVARARAGDGPTLIECLVDRLGAHSSEDDQRRYRSQEEIDLLAQSDCLERFKKQLIDEGVLKAKQVTEYEEQVKAEVAAATTQGMQADDPRPEDALTNVYAIEAPKAIDPAAGAETAASATADVGPAAAVVGGSPTAVISTLIRLPYSSEANSPITLRLSVR